MAVVRAYQQKKARPENAGGHGHTGWFLQPVGEPARWRTTPGRNLITRFRLPYKFGPGYLEPFLMFQNLLNTEYKQAQFFFESRLPNEPDPVADIHFTPGAPLGVLGGIGFLF
jgi:hypothetical protein